MKRSNLGRLQAEGIVNFRIRRTAQWLAAGVATAALWLGSAPVSPMKLGLAAQTKAVAKAPASEAAPVKGIGTKGAPITVEVFSDFQCPSCRDLFLQTLRPLIQNYVASGKVYLIHRDFPLQQHAHARQAARYANAAARIGKLEKVAEALYLSQDIWAGTGDLESIVARVLTPSEMNELRKQLKDGKVDASIEQDVALGGRNQVRSTPTTIITHRGKQTPIVGAVSYSILRLYIEDLLRQ